MSDIPDTCLYCQRSAEEVPLVTLKHRGQLFYICPQHLPLLIHHPEKLADRLPGARNLTSFQHSDAED